MIAPMTRPLLEVSELSVRFETEEGPVYAVDRLSFGVGAGEVLGIVGESGCGKSTAALALVRLLPDPASVDGSVILDGRDVLALPPRALRAVRARDVSYVFQEPLAALDPVLTIGVQLREVLTRLGLSRRTAHLRAAELLRLVHIREPERVLRVYPHQLSGGMRQRVVIALALACEPRILIADEPTTAVDVTIQAAILELLADVRDRLGTAIVLITHNLGVVARLADRVLVMYAGRKAEEAPVRELFATPEHPYTNALLAAIPRVHDPSGPRLRLQEIPGRIPVLRELDPGCAYAARCPRADAFACLVAPTTSEVAPAHLVACYHPGPA
jgi:peptide/nickel transport system ATP-binding protein